MVAGALYAVTIIYTICKKAYFVTILSPQPWQKLEIHSIRMNHIWYFAVENNFLAVIQDFRLYIVIMTFFLSHLS